MAAYVIKYHPDALNDLAASYEWGFQVWGAEAAEKWYNDIESAIETRLAAMPSSCPVAPENSGFDIEIRHLILGRYRILFTISGEEVDILRLQGPFSGG